MKMPWSQESKLLACIGRFRFVQIPNVLYKAFYQVACFSWCGSRSSWVFGLMVVTEENEGIDPIQVKSGE